MQVIAEGNPDEEKIGAFGVGFYSLFSVTEEPFVTSGGTRFYRTRY
jgi:HSP90 family molecular chaperone